MQILLPVVVTIALLVEEGGMRGGGGDRGLEEGGGRVRVRVYVVGMLIGGEGYRRRGRR